MDNYDVFITCKSEDYGFAEEIYDFLTQNGIKVFLASKELRSLGESEYRKAISFALQQAYHLIIFASKAEYIDSNWVYYEWDMFVNAKLKGYKVGNIVTILKGIPTNEINMDLWKYESLTYDRYKDSIIQYVETPSSKKRQQERIAQKEREELEKNKAIKLKERLLRTAEQYKKNYSTLEIAGNEIWWLMKQLHIDSKVCPVCGKENPIDKRYCSDCGNSFSPLEGINGAEYLSNLDREQLTLKKKVYSQSITAVTAENEKQELTTSLNQANDKIKEYEEELSRQKETGPTSISNKIPNLKRWYRRILPLITVVLAGLLGFCIWDIHEKNSYNDWYINSLQEESYSLSEEVREQTELMDSLAEYLPDYIVTDITVQGERNPIKAESSTYIYPQVTLISPEDISSKQIDVKLYTPDGNLSQGSSSSEDYSYSSEIRSVVKWKPTTFKLSGWGNDTVGHWDRGKYRIELWIDGKCIGQSYFRIY